MKTVILMSVVMLFGCAQLMRAEDKSAAGVAKAITEYCANTDATFRAKFRAEVNAKAAPVSIKVTCP